MAIVAILQVLDIVYVFFESLSKHTDISGVNVAILDKGGTLEELNDYNLLPSTFVKGINLAITHHQDITSCSSHTNANDGYCFSVY